MLAVRNAGGIHKDFGGLRRQAEARVTRCMVRVLWRRRANAVHRSTEGLRRQACGADGFLGEGGGGER